MNVVTQAKDHENRLSRHKSDCGQTVWSHRWLRGSKPNWNGVQIRVVQLVFQLSNGNA